MKTRNRTDRRGFTLLEIMIVVAIIGLLASIAYPAYAKARTTTQRTHFINDMRVFADAAEIFMLDTGTYLEDSSSGAMPGGFDPYVSTTKWTGLTPIGGVWDVELDSFGIKAGLGVVFSGDSPGLPFMQRVDAEFDDGDLTTGKFRQIAPNRFYYILEEA